MAGSRVRKIGGLLLAVGVGAAAAVYAGLPHVGQGKSVATAAEPAAMNDAKQPAAVVVTIAPVTARAVERRVRTVGTLHGFDEIEIAPLVDGRVLRILHEVGDVVRPGDALLEIDDADFRLTVQEMGRALELELSRLGLREVPDESFDVATLPSVLRAQLVEKNAAQTLERYQGLVGQNAITKDEFEKSQLNLDVARLDTKQRLIEAEQNLAAVRHRQAILETAQKRLRDAKIVAPPITALAGNPQPQINLVSTAGAPAPARPSATSFTISERLVSEGEIVRASPPTNLFHLVVEDPLKLRAAIPERFAAQVRVGQAAELATEALPGRTIAGVVVRVNPTVDTASRTFQVEVSVPNPERMLKPGSFATASILVGRDTDAATVPEESIVRFAGVTKLFVVEQEKARAVPVELGTRLDVGGGAGGERWVEVLGELPAGAQVVTTGHSQLSDGSAVRIRSTAAAPQTLEPAASRDVQAARTLEAAAPRKEAR